MNLDDRKKLRALAKLLREASDAIRSVPDVPGDQLREAQSHAFRAAQYCTDAVLEDEQTPRSTTPVITHEWDAMNCGVCGEPVSGEAIVGDVKGVFTAFHKSCGTARVA